mgnify:CR=1 FL=1
MLSLSRCNNVNDLRSLAKRRLPRSMFHYIDGASEDAVAARSSCRSRPRTARSQHAFVRQAALQPRRGTLADPAAVTRVRGRRPSRGSSAGYSCRVPDWWYPVPTGYRRARNAGFPAPHTTRQTRPSTMPKVISLRASGPMTAARTGTAGPRTAVLAGHRQQAGYRQPAGRTQSHPDPGAG